MNKQPDLPVPLNLMRLEVDYLEKQTPQLVEALRYFLDGDWQEVLQPGTLGWLRLDNLRLFTQFVRQSCERIEGVLELMEERRKKEEQERE